MQNITPTSAPSVTLMPNARPARAIRAQRFKIVIPGVMDTTNASPMKTKPKPVS